MGRKRKDYGEMSKAYDKYLIEHKKNVRDAYYWMQVHGIIPKDEQLGVHDASKSNHREYYAYDKHFYGTEEEKAKSQETFDYAWLEHIHRNPHHWQYWVLIEDEGSIKPLKMSNDDVYEMIADWWSFSWKDGNLDEIFDWYGKHKEKMILHTETRKMVEDILEKIGKELDKIEKEKDDE